MSDKPNMYGILPANVRYHEGLSSFAKLLYTEINSLSNKHGYCFATNAYFAKVFNKSTATVSRVLTELKECGAITIADGEGGELTRKITPCSSSKKLKVITYHLNESDKPPLIENEEHNNTSINNTSILNTNVLSEEVETSSKPPRLKLPTTGKSSLNRLVSFYSLLWKAKYGTSPTINFPRAGKSLKPLVDGLGEYGAALVILQYFHWRGATGDDAFLVRRLEGATYPLYWIAEFADSIRAYLRNVVKLDVDSEEQVKMVVNRKLAELGIPATV